MTTRVNRLLIGVCGFGDVDVHQLMEWGSIEVRRVTGDRRHATFTGGRRVEEIGESEIKIVPSERVSQENSPDCAVLVQRQDTLYPLIECVSVLVKRGLW